jgi:hypothetical protein
MPFPHRRFQQNYWVSRTNSKIIHSHICECWEFNNLNSRNWTLNYYRNSLSLIASFGGRLFF